MKKYLMIPFLFGCVCSFSYGGVTIKTAGAQVVWDDGGEHFGNFKTFNAKPGVKLALILETNEHSFVNLDQQDTNVTIGGVKGQCWLFGSSAISKDGKFLRVEVGGDGAKPVKGKVEAKGEITVTTASGKGQVSTEMIQWKPGQEVRFPEDAGLPTFKIDKIGKPKWGDDKWEVTLKCNKDFEKFVSVKFVDEKGHEHKAKRGSWSSMGVMGIKTVSVSYRSPDEISKAKMVAEVWNDVKKIKVPVSLSVGMDGLSQ